MMQINAAIVREAKAPFQIEPVELADPVPGEVLVRVAAVGMCHTDLSVVAGHIPFPPFPCILGHEGAGVVAAVGPGVTDLAVGDHVVMSFAFCGECQHCLAGQPAYCAQFFMQNFGGRSPDGRCCHQQDGTDIQDNFFGQSSFASHAVVATRHLVKVEADLPLELLAPLGCGLQTGAGAVLNYLEPGPASSIAVFGAGAVGMAAIMAARALDCGTIIAVDINPDRLTLARELGATHVIDSRTEAVKDVIAAITGGGVTHSVEATGIPTVMAQAIEALAKPGKAALLGAARFGAKVELDMLALAGGVTIKAITEGDAVPRKFIPELIELYRQGRFPMDRLIRFYDFEGINQAAHDAEAGIAIKPVIRMPAA